MFLVKSPLGLVPYMCLKKCSAKFERSTTLGNLCFKRDEVLIDFENLFSYNWSRYI